MSIANSDECYRHLIGKRGLDGDGDPDLIGLFAYALAEKERLDWIAHRKSEGLGEPSDKEISDWYRQKTPSYFDDKLKQAVTRFDGYARGYLEEEIELSRREAVKQALGNLQADIKAGNWGRAILQGALGNGLFAVIIISCWVIAVYNQDVVAWARAFLK